MDNLDLPLRFPRNYYANRRPTNLNLDKSVMKKATTLAQHRYGYSLSELVNQLLETEVRLKEGLLTKQALSRRK